MVQDAKKAFTARSSKRGEKYSSGQTYFVGCLDEPRCELETLAKHLFAVHTAHLEPGVDYVAEESGAEWWTLVLNPEDDVGLHWDRDYSIEADSDVHIHPHVATVTYLTGGGAPTMVFDMVGSMQGSDFPPGRPHQFRDVFLSRPRVGKHISFDGRLLHGAPADANLWVEGGEKEGGGGPRVTFLVNVWLNYVPTSTERLPPGTSRPQTRNPKP